MNFPRLAQALPVPTPVLRTAVVGLGWAGRAIWLPRLLRHPRYQVVAAVEPHPGVREAAAAEFPGVPVVSSVDELSAVDLAIVAVPNHLHATVACGLLERGLSVFVEKPVCLT
ncbi:MAG: Gfo/Idh/MocA family oxidoreductase, partial [Catenulispora sp.]|nr:Gfo/Idh/MocA family oxidoreductase [Catenulispora sp.]